MSSKAIVLLSLAFGLAACGSGRDVDPGTGGGAPAAMQTPAPVVVPPPIIVTQPAPQAAAIGASVTFSVSATGNNLSYQWKRDGKDIAGATAAGYTLNDIQATDDGAVFAVEIGNGGASTVSAGAALQVEVPKGLSLVAGQLGGPGNLDGKDGRFLHIVAAAVDPAGLVHVVDSGNGPSGPGRLRTVDPATGAVTTRQSYTTATLPIAICFDAAGNRFELTPTSVYRITPAGVRTLLAGTGGAGAGSGIVPPPGGAGDIGTLSDMALDGAGNVVVVDARDRVVRKVDPSGRVVALAGGGGDQAADGNGAKAAFQNPSRLAVDRAGNVFVVDLGAGDAPRTSTVPSRDGTSAGAVLNDGPTLLRKIAPDGTVTTLKLKTAAGAVDALGQTGGALAFDANGSLYVTDTSQGCRVRRIGADGTVTDVAGSAEATGAADGKGAAARFCGTSVSSLTALSADRAGNLIVPDAANNTIRRVTPSGEVATIAGRAASDVNLDGKGPAAAFMFAAVPNPSPFDRYVRGYSMSADAQGNLYVGAGDRIRKVGAAGDVATLPAAAGAARDARYYPGGLAYGRGALVVSNNVVSRIDADGTPHFVAGQPAAPHARIDGTGAGADFANPYELVMDGLGTIYLHDAVATGEPVFERKIAPDGATAPVTKAASRKPILTWHADKDGNLITANLDGSVSLIKPNGDRTDLRHATADSLREQTTAITRDAAGNIYMATNVMPDQNDSHQSWNMVRKIAPDGTETIVAGTSGSSGVRLGAPGSLGRVDALAAGPDGILYLMTENAVLRLKQ